jgi:hypothetical protein
VINWFGRSKSEHPLADVRKVHELIAKLPTGDSAQALGEIAGWLELMSHADDLGLEPRLKNLDLLDTAARLHEHALMVEYLGTPRQKKTHEQKLWSAAFGFWKELGEGYLKCLRQYEEDAKNAGTGKDTVPLFMGRAMRALKQQLKWVLLRYEIVESRIWRDMARLYQVAESRNFADHAVAVYPGTAAAGTVKQEYLKALMLAASSPESLPPVGQDLASRLVAHFAGMFLLESKPVSGCTHWFDLAAPNRPVRLLRNVPQVPTVRYIGAGPALRELEQVRAHIAYTRSLPEGLDLDGKHDDEMVQGLLKHLEQDWAGKTQARQHERRKVATRVTVVPGLDEIIEALEFANNDSLDFTHRQSAESWIVEDMSEGGYGAVIPAVAGDWVEVGSLIGVEGETFRDWRIGLIRRVTRNAQHQQRVGVQLLTQHGALVSLTLSKDTAAAPQPAVLIPSSLVEQTDVDIVAHRDNWEGRDFVEMRADDRSYLLKPKETVERGSDYDLVRFKILRAPR